METLIQDLRYAVRGLLKSPSFAVVAVLTLGLGIGANTAIFTFINVLLMRPVPGVVEPERLARLTRGGFSYAKFEALKARGIFDNTVALNDTRLPAEINGSMQPVRVLLASGDYFSALGVLPFLGRTISPEDDRIQAPVAVLSHRFWARAFSADLSALGKRINFGGLPVTSPLGRIIAPLGGDTSNPDTEIVGVVQDATHFDLKEPPKRVVYVPYDQGPDFLEGQNMILEVRSVSALATVVSQLRDLVAQVDKNVVVETETLQSHVDSSIVRERLLAVLSGFLGMLSLLLVAIGMYGVMAHSVTRRRGEIGVRLALGARPATLLSMMLREGAVLVLTGVAIGLLTALAVSRVVATLLFGIGARDVTTFAGAVGLIALVALLATLLPASRAARLNPLAALRYE